MMKIVRVIVTWGLPMTMSDLPNHCRRALAGT